MFPGFAQRAHSLWQSLSFHDLRSSRDVFSPRQNCGVELAKGLLPAVLNLT